MFYYYLVIEYISNVCLLSIILTLRHKKTNKGNLHKPFVYQDYSTRVARVKYNM